MRGVEWALPPVVLNSAPDTSCERGEDTHGNEAFQLA
jgi:hypothetical protein